jgi:hypothetical protein
VPDKPGKMQEYTPTPAAIRQHAKEAERIANLIAFRMKTRDAFVFVIKSHQDAIALRTEFDRHAAWLKRVLGDSRLTIPDRAALMAKLTALVRRADAALGR